MEKKRAIVSPAVRLCLGNGERRRPDPSDAKPSKIDCHFEESIALIADKAHCQGAPDSPGKELCRDLSDALAEHRHRREVLLKATTASIIARLEKARSLTANGIGAQANAGGRFESSTIVPVVSA
jgi:hypothetical protein